MIKNQGSVGVKKKAARKKISGHLSVALTHPRVKIDLKEEKKTTRNNPPLKTYHVRIVRMVESHVRTIVIQGGSIQNVKDVAGTEKLIRCFHALNAVSDNKHLQTFAPDYLQHI